MKKLSGLLVAGLILGSANLFAQVPEEDSMVNANNKTQRDSTWRLKSSNNKRDTMSSAKSMQKDTAWRSTNNYNKRDSMQSGQSMNHDTMGNQKHQMSGYAGDGDKSTNKNSSNNKMTSMMTPDVSSWPEASKMAVDEITAKYGKPDGVTAEELFWLEKGIWKKICVTKMESKHSFPIEHTDMMQTTINYDVPEDKMDDLGKFDGSVTFDRTQGTMSARCDKEGNNFLALNLAHDIVTGKKTVVSARKAYGDIVKLKMKGGNPLYMAKLTFTPKLNTADPDKNTTGLTKEEVTRAVTQNEKK